MERTRVVKSTGTRQLIFLALLAPLLSAGHRSPTGKAAEDAPVVQISSGAVRGRVREGVLLFAGIPYAAPPVGARRWRAPAPVSAWRETADTTHFGPDCPQPARKDADKAPQSENCLTINVATPDAHARKLPVLVAIHGGAYFVGSGRELLKKRIPPIVGQGVVLVAPNYRLGRLGFFAHPALGREAPGATANYWLMDQVAALRWVRQNIARFGGDPENVTIIGCSAGGSSVNALMATPMARGLFARASAHSGGGLFNANRPLARSERQGMDFAERVGVKGDDKAALARLRALGTAQILAGDSGAPDFGAVVDGHWLPQPISTLFANGAMAHVPLMTGSTSNEASVFGLMGFDRAALSQRFGIDLNHVAPVYGVSDERELLRQVQTDFLFTSAAMGMTDLAARAGIPAWSYHFDHVDAAHRATAPGASHCADMPYWFGLLDGPAPGDAGLSQMMQGYLLNYVRTGDPNGPGLPPWTASSAGTASPLLIRADARMAPGFRDRQLALWYAKWAAESGQTLDLEKKP